MSAPYEISAAYARLMLRSRLLPLDALLKETGVTADYLMSADYINWQVLATMFHNVDMHKGRSSAWAARLGGQFNISAHGSLGFAALSAPTLGEALEALVEFYPSRVNAIKIELSAGDGYYTMRVVDVTGDADFNRSLAEIVLKVAESLLAAILGHPAGENVLVSLARPAPEVAEKFSSVFDTRLVFGAAANSISLPASWWRLPSPLHDESTYWANVAKCRELIASRDQSGSAAFIVRSHLKNHFDRQIAGETEQCAPPTQEAIAQAMHLATRTLIRRLAKEEAAYQDILEELRREYSQALLGNARLTVAGVGELLGYSEPANFGRAFRRWFGLSPGKWRYQ